MHTAAVNCPAPAASSGCCPNSGMIGRVNSSSTAVSGGETISTFDAHAHDRAHAIAVRTIATEDVRDHRRYSRDRAAPISQQKKKIVAASADDAERGLSDAAEHDVSVVMITICATCVKMSGSASFKVSRASSRQASQPWPVTRHCQLENLAVQYGLLIRASLVGRTELMGSIRYKNPLQSLAREG